MEWAQQRMMLAEERPAAGLGTLVDEEIVACRQQRCERDGAGRARIIVQQKSSRGVDRHGCVVAGVRSFAEVLGSATQNVRGVTVREPGRKRGLRCKFATGAPSLDDSQKGRRRATHSYMQGGGAAGVADATVVVM